MNLLVYGANGYSGELIAKVAAGRGLRPILAGRSGAAVEKIATALGLPHRAFDLADPSALDAGLEGVQAVLHCAGPFSRTARPMVDACLRSKVHYLDITGEVAVFEACAARDAEARKAGVMVMPGVGFDVVPTDCLAAHLARRLPGATYLALGFQAHGGVVSRGTATTMIENLHAGGLVREEGQLKKVPSGHRTRRIDFGRGERTAMTIPWGDVSTAYHSTKIPNIEVYTAVPRGTQLGARFLSAAGPLLRSAPVQSLLKSFLAGRQAGPSDEQREQGRSYVWGEAQAGARRVVSRIEGPDGYTMTALTALEIARRVLTGDVQVGYQTPSSAYGADLILAIEGCTRSDE